MPCALAYSPLYPETIALDYDNVYVLISGNETIENFIHVYSPHGYEMIPRGDIIGIASTGKGYVYWLNEFLYYDSRNITITRTGSDGRSTIIYRNSSTSYYPGYVVGAIATDDEGNLYIYSYYTYQNYTSSKLGASLGDPIKGSEKIIMLDPDGNLLKLYGNISQLSLSGRIKMSIVGNGTIYIANRSGNITVIYPNGTLTVYNVFKADDHFNTINDIAVGSDGSIYLADEYYDDYNNGTYRGMIIRFGSDGKLVSVWNGCGLDDFYNARDIELNNNKIYVADPGNQRIIWLDVNNYSYGNDRQKNVDGFNGLWGNVVAGDNYTMSQQKRIDEMTYPPHAVPGFVFIAVIVSLIIIFLFIDNKINK
ncbi:MAG: SMP-30/Gluconolaconase/LRE-like region [Methanocella sp. PtaU1.Bin125]|nr:MAG: SMP-30/Gluconolaconase/LRE-like region [Methanocella sp. PtaU1.Bin125]